MTLLVNQFVIVDTEGNIWFQSYETMIAVIDADEQVTLDAHHWDHSVTTGKYRNQFLNEDKKATLRKIENGTYKLKDLNRVVSKV